MQQLNDDMDDLVRSAAESYPLKISGANWDAVAARIAEEDGAATVAPVIPLNEGRVIGRYKYLLLAMLLPFAFFMVRYVFLPKNVNPTEEGNQQTQAQVKGAENNKGDNTGVANTTKQNGLQVVPPVTAATAADGVKQNNIATPVNSQGATAGAKFVVKTYKGTVAGGVTNGKGIPTLSNLGSQEDNVAKPAPGTANNDEVKSAALNNSTKPLEVLPQAEGANNQAVDVNGKDKKASENVEALRAAIPTPLVHANKPRKFYIGAFVAPDYTTVKYQPGSKVGFTFGGIVGYSLSKNLSIEAGISIDRKYYTTDGKYFNPKISWLNNFGKVLELSGYAGLTEFPVSVKYDFKKNRDGNFFVTAGFISSIVHEENYTYTFDKNGVVYTKDKSTKISTNSMFNNASISLGYEGYLGNHVNFRLEPYYRVPIHGIGIGNLPMTNIGLNIGVIKKIK